MEDINEIKKSLEKLSTRKISIEEQLDKAKGSAYDNYRLILVAINNDIDTLLDKYNEYEKENKAC